jgi:hypothetical protein
MSGLPAASLRNGTTGRLPSAARALAIPAKHVMSVGEQHAVPPGVYVAGHEAGGEIATLWKSAADSVRFMLLSQELSLSSMIAAPVFMSAVRLPPNAMLLRRIPTDSAAPFAYPSMSKSVPLL